MGAIPSDEGLSCGVATSVVSRHPTRVSLMHGDRAKIEKIADHIHPRTSPSQMVAVLGHLALARIPEDQIQETLSRLNDGAGKKA